MQAAHDGADGDVERAGRLRVGEAEQVDGDDDLALRLGEGGDAGEDLARLARAVRVAAGAGLVQVEVRGGGEDGRAAGGVAPARVVRVAQHLQQVGQRGAVDDGGGG